MRADRIDDAWLKRFHSPFRYPGGKRTFAPTIARLIRDSGGADLYVEPFCGGASVAVALLKAGLVGRIALNDGYPPMGGFWSVLFSDRGGELADRVRACRPTLEMWKLISAERETGEPVEDAFRTLFLNRTSFSGIVHRNVGPIGGHAQKSEYTVDCRWNGPEIARRIDELSALRDRVAMVRSLDWAEFSEQAMASGEDAFWYFDPPYFRKADSIYGRWFEGVEEHVRLKDFLLSDRAPRRWVLSYDGVPEAREAWSSHPGYFEGAFATHYVMQRWRTKEKTVKKDEVVVVSPPLAGLMRKDVP